MPLLLPLKHMDVQTMAHLTQSQAHMNLLPTNTEKEKIEFPLMIDFKNFSQYNHNCTLEKKVPMAMDAHDL